ncbi:MAG: hypothetical protein AABY27_02165 [Pseudomonadota bacterium]
MSYYSIFYKNLGVGFNIGKVTIISGIITKPLLVYKYPFLNRMFEIGVFNILQNDYFSPIPISTAKNFVDNSIYRGIFQGVKWFPNFWIQNQVKENFKDSDLKSFYIPLTGMVAFFTIGGVEAVYKDKQSKLIFNFLAASLIVNDYILQSVNETIKKSNGEIYLSKNDCFAAAGGLIASFLLLDIAHLFKATDELPKFVSLNQLTAVTMLGEAGFTIYNQVNHNNVTLYDASKTALWQSAEELMKIGAFTLAKATGVVVANFAYDSFINMDIPAIAFIGLMAIEVNYFYDSLT